MSDRATDSAFGTYPSSDSEGDLPGDVITGDGHDARISSETDEQRGEKEAEAALTEDALANRAQPRIA
jgi:hypothetical protein